MLLRPVVALSLLTVSTIVIFSTSAMADTIDLNLRDSSAQFQYISSMGRDALGKSVFHLGVLYVDSHNVLADFGLFVKDELGGNAPGFSVGVGIKGLAAKVTSSDNTTNNDASAVALGGLVRYSPPTIPRFGVVGMVYLSPNILTFGDADRYIETQARMEFEIIPQSVIYLGYRKIDFGLKSQPNTTLDEGAYIGVKISF
jgi:hypothetical protein